MKPNLAKIFVDVNSPDMFLRSSFAPTISSSDCEARMHDVIGVLVRCSSEIQVTESRKRQVHVLFRRGSVFVYSNRGLLRRMRYRKTTPGERGAGLFFGNPGCRNHENAPDDREIPFFVFMGKRAGQ
jgi:hypothetical protein